MSDAKNIPVLIFICVFAACNGLSQLGYYLGKRAANKNIESMMLSERAKAYQDGKDRTMALMQYALMQEGMFSLNTIVVESGAVLSNCNITVISFEGNASGVFVGQPPESSCYMEGKDWPMTTVSHCTIVFGCDFMEGVEFIK